MLFGSSDDSSPPIVGLDVGHTTTQAAIWDTDNDEPILLELSADKTLESAIGLSPEQETFVGHASSYQEDCMLMSSFGYTLPDSVERDEEAKEGNEMIMETFFSKLFNLIQAEAPSWEGDVAISVTDMGSFESNVNRHLDKAGFNVLEKVPVTTAIHLAHRYNGRMLVPREHRQTGAHNTIILDIGSETTNMAIIEQDRLENIHIHEEGNVNMGGRVISDKIIEHFRKTIKVPSPHPSLPKLPSVKAATSEFLAQLPSEGEAKGDLLVASESGLETRQVTLDKNVYMKEVNELAHTIVFNGLGNMLVNESPFERSDIDLMLTHGQPMKWPNVIQSIKEFGGQPWSYGSESWISEKAFFPVIANSGFTHAAALGASVYGASERGDIERPEIEYNTADYT